VFIVKEKLDQQDKPINRSIYQITGVLLSMKRKLMALEYLVHQRDFTIQYKIIKEKT